ncbi:hypothetical protein PUND_a1353 [Pseudoalteromonas undina]|uniref:Permease n=1 Tax=Pseudoalteromonas undina TaxID=43660 RepID=A0ABN0NF66_9GAMM|nr:hypothetical protein [Pseudoalteromonas undina]KAF7765644.1 hypothetical protein PUND_a1353 [Pseudoalteromonas undina]
MVSWLVLKDIYELKVIKGTAIWIFIVPAFVKFFSIFDSSEIIDASYVFFNSYVLFGLYFSALSFFLGSIVFNLRCPSLNKGLHGYDAFQEKGMTIYNLAEYTNELAESDALKYKPILKNVSSQFESHYIDNGKTYTLERTDQTICQSFLKDELPLIFWSLYVFTSKTRSISQFFCWLFLFFGFAGLLLVLLRNLTIVIEFLMDALN